jgi:hypothetical protein
MDVYVMPVKKSKKLKIDPKELFCHKNICFSLNDDKNQKRADKHKKQRISRGFDDSETWALDETIASFILPRIKRYKEINIAYPATDGMTFEKWNEILDEIIKTFEFIKNQTYDKWGRDQEETKKKMAEIDNGLNLFAQWFVSLGW